MAPVRQEQCSTTSRWATSEPASDPAFYVVVALLFAASAATTVGWCSSMSGMDGMAMHGGWTMSMTWMRMPGQTWAGAAASFVGMWAVMMVAMMLPVLVPVLRGYRIAVQRTAVGSMVAETGATSNGRLMMIAVGYFFVWTVVGVGVFPVGIALASIAMQEPALAMAVPIATGTIVLLAGLFQLTAAKARYLACCRHAFRCAAPHANAATAWRDGVRLALRCARCCANLMAILLVIGVMDLRAMAVVTAVIAAERLAPPTERIVRAIGVVAIAAGLMMIAQAGGLL